MPITVTCEKCKQRLKAKDSLAGRRVACPKCRTILAVPQLDEDAADFLLGNDEAPMPPPRSAKANTEPETHDEPPEDEPQETPAAPVKRKPKPITMKEPPPWLRHLHWLLVIALIPLAFALVREREPLQSIESRLLRTLDNAPPDVAERAERILDQVEQGRASIERLFDLLPNRRIEGAHVSRGSQIQWVYALLATVVFLGFILVLASYEGDQSSRLLWIGLFTATVGIMLLLGLQEIANWSAKIGVAGRGILLIFLFIAKLIGFSYHAALDPDNGFMASFVGFTAGVGFCEEVCKAGPLIFLLRRHSRSGWRTFFLWGLASGAGFGIAEGVIYSANVYNGIESGGIYFVRFVSCVALHALWTGSVGITLQQNQYLFEAAENWLGYLLSLLRVVAVPMILHGLYDTLLKKDMPGFALLTALASFGFLAFQISRLHSADDDRERAAMLRRYQKQRKATQ